MELPHPLPFDRFGATLSMGLTPRITLRALFIKLPMAVKLWLRQLKKEIMVSYPFN